MLVPTSPKIYHILHVDKLNSIANDGFLWCDIKISSQSFSGTMIGMEKIKQRRRNKTLASYSDLHVGDCVPFYFCPRSVMLYLISCQNHPELSYQDGQSEIIHLEADLYDSIKWASRHNKRWVFTLSNAGSVFFEDRCDLEQLHEINWSAVASKQWGGSHVAPETKEHKQAEFLIEFSYPWHLIERIGVKNNQIAQKISDDLFDNQYCPKIEVIKDWYY